MPVPGFLASFADKAQSAIQASPLASHLPSGRSSSPDPTTQPPANEAAAHGGYKSHALDSIQNQLRAFGQQYTTTSPVQKIITIEKGVAIDFDGVSRDAKTQSKELYTWGQNELEDLKDVTDRLAYLNFVQGSLASTLATKLDAARAPLKALRDAETSLTPRRNIRAGLNHQLARLEHEQQKGMERKIAELKDQIRKAELDDQAQEKEVVLLKRKVIRESEQLKWEAMREYGEKLVLLSQAATPIITALPTIPPTQTNPYTGAQATGAARASLQRALDNYKTGHINLPPSLADSDLSRSDTRSFGESHAIELSSIASLESDVTGITHGPVVQTPQTSNKPLPSTHTQPASVDKTQSPPINPASLNQSPASIPLSSTNIPLQPASVPIVTSDVSTSPRIPVITPTVAETGVPVTAGSAGPGPASGSLHDIKAASPNAGPRSGVLPSNDSQAPVYGQVGDGGMVAGSPKHDSAEEEKRQLHAAYSQAPNAGLADQPHTSTPGPATPSTTSVPIQESAEDEKKHLEREERERLLRTGTSSGPPARKDGDEDLPPYQVT